MAQIGLTTDIGSDGTYTYRRDYLIKGQPHYDILDEDGLILYTTIKSPPKLTPSVAEIHTAINRLEIKLHQSMTDPGYNGYPADVIQQKITYLRSVI